MPGQSDRDVLDILNLMYPDKHYEVPVVTIHSDPPPTCHPTRITEVAGSFLFLLDDALGAGGLPARDQQLVLLGPQAFQYPGGTTEPLPVDARERTSALLDDLGRDDLRGERGRHSGGAAWLAAAGVHRGPAAAAEGQLTPGSGLYPAA